MKFQNSKMGINVFKLSCKEFFSGHFKTQDFFWLWNFFQKKMFFKHPCFLGLINETTFIPEFICIWRWHFWIVFVKKKTPEGDRQLQKSIWNFLSRLKWFHKGYATLIRLGASWGLIDLWKEKPMILLQQLPIFFMLLAKY